MYSAGRARPVCDVVPRRTPSPQRTQEDGA
jgi:hypothetical protein